MNDANSTHAQRLRLLARELEDRDLDAIIVPHEDEYLSEYLTPDLERVAFTCGFTGSAGVVLALREQSLGEPVPLPHGQEARRAACIITDGRYVVQARGQVDPGLFDCFNLREVGVGAWLRAMLPKGGRVGIDLSCIDYQRWQGLTGELSAAQVELVDTEGSLVDGIWEDRPEPPCPTVEIYPDEYNGLPSMEKRRNLANALREGGLDATIIGDPCSICWLLNIRSKAHSYLPVVNCRLVAYANDTLEWYIDDRHLDPALQEELENHIGHVNIFPASAFGDLLERLSSAACKVQVDPSTLNASIMSRLEAGGATVLQGMGLCDLPRARKNDVEIAGEYKAHIKDGVAMCRFLAWLDRASGQSEDEGEGEIRPEDLDEEALAARAEAFRADEGAFRGLSFATISALGPNAAMCHYNHREAGAPRRLGQDPLYLIDSGAHFLEGTTDITRTVLVGPGLTEEMRTIYTLVLKAHISLATAVFPQGTAGNQLDALARRPLWDYGLDFEHGTGHGVGHLLSVHEGPQSISPRRPGPPLEPGMVLSIEPGYYREGQFGFRLENLVVVEKCPRLGLEGMLSFSPLTMVPFDRRLISKDLLTPRERNYLNEYHHHVREHLRGASRNLSEADLRWLESATRAI
ncbi:MAG: aminopeptidase P family protein [Succinivibrionaceae bacterium]|nr:aminopeptidase P family protein [Succinivibrionaceae bacterium]